MISLGASRTQHNGAPSKRIPLARTAERELEGRMKLTLLPALLLVPLAALHATELVRVEISLDTSSHLIRVKWRVAAVRRRS